MRALLGVCMEPVHGTGKYKRGDMQSRAEQGCNKLGMYIITLLVCAHAWVLSRAAACQASALVGIRNRKVHNAPLHQESNNAKL